MADGLVVDSSSTFSGSQKLMQALIKILKLNFLFNMTFIFIQTVEWSGDVNLQCTMHEDERRKGWD
jgi:hypothetical protein